MVDPTREMSQPDRTIAPSQEPPTQDPSLPPLHIHQQDQAQNYPSHHGFNFLTTEEQLECLLGSIGQAEECLFPGLPLGPPGRLPQLQGSFNAPPPNGDAIVNPQDLIHNRTENPYENIHMNVPEPVRPPQPSKPRSNMTSNHQLPAIDLTEDDRLTQAFAELTLQEAHVTLPGGARHQIEIVAQEFRDRGLYQQAETIIIALNRRFGHLRLESGTIDTLNYPDIGPQGPRNRRIQAFTAQDGRIPTIRWYHPTRTARHARSTAPAPRAPATGATPAAPPAPSADATQAPPVKRKNPIDPATGRPKRGRPPGSTKKTKDSGPSSQTPAVQSRTALPAPAPGTSAVFPFEVDGNEYEFMDILRRRVSPLLTSMHVLTSAHSFNEQSQA